MPNEEETINDPRSTRTRVQAAALSLIRADKKPEVLRAFEAVVERIRNQIEVGNIDESLLQVDVEHAYSFYSPLKSTLDGFKIDTRNLHAVFLALQKRAYDSSEASRDNLHEHLTKVLAALYEHLESKGSKPVKFKIFYSWQSDLPSACNRGFVQTALEAAAKTLRVDNSIQVEPVVDRDTAGVAGSPDIGRTILRKIDESHAFVADVSIVNAGQLRLTPNPNVLFELGYAWNTLTENRIVMVMNTAFGSPEQLPFDLRMKRVLPYNSPMDAQERATERKTLTSRLTEALRGVIEHPLAAKGSQATSEELRRIFLQALPAKLAEHNKIANWFHSIIGSVARTRRWCDSYEAFLAELEECFEGDRPMRRNDKFIGEFVECYTFWDDLGRLLYNENLNLISSTELTARFSTVEYVPHLLELLRFQKRPLRPGVWTVAILYLQDALEYRAPTWSKPKQYLEHLKLELANNCVLDFDIEGKESPIRIRNEAAR